MSSQANYNQLNAMFAIARASLRSILKSPSAVVFTLAFPLIFIVVFGFIGRGAMHLDLGVTKNSLQNNAVYQALAHDSSFVSLIAETDSAAMYEALRKGNLDAIVSIRPDTVPNRLKIHLTVSDAKAQTRTIVTSVINNIILDTYKHNPAFDAMPILVNPNIEETVISNREYKSIDFILPGQLGFSLLSTGVFGVAFVFLNLRQTMVLKRFFATPIKRPYIVLGEALARLTFAMMGALIIILIGKFVFGFTLVNGVVTVINMLILSVIGLVVFMGFGFLVSGIAKTESSVPPLANIVTLPQFLLAGTFFPISAFPSWLQPISYALPLTYLNDAMRKVAFDGVPLYMLTKDIGILALWGIVVYALAIKFFRWE
jgi:ABC-2 type transport system permease protein